MLLVIVLIAVLAGYGALGYREAANEAETLRSRADALIEGGRGGAGLGVDRLQMLIDVEDPAFRAHVGLDFTTPGAGPETITQAVARQMATVIFGGNVARLRRTGYALALERNLSKPQILALFLDTVVMGPGPDGVQVTGFWQASEAHFGAPPDMVANDAYLRLLAVMIDPSELQLADPGPRLADRTARIAALLAGRCAPLGHDDVWLDGCSGT